MSSTYPTYRSSQMCDAEVTLDDFDAVHNWEGHRPDPPEGGADPDEKATYELLDEDAVAYWGQFEEKGR
jgi:hypothetical protein